MEGTFAFVAGQVAHTGEGMKINTPVATMGIRGTVGLFRTEPTVINSNLGHVWSVFLHEDIDGSHHLGRIALDRSGSDLADLRPGVLSVG